MWISHSDVPDCSLLAGVSLGFWVKANGRSSLPIQESQKQRGCPPGRCISSYCCCTATPSQSIVASSDAICASLATASWDGADVLVLRLPGGQCKCLPLSKHRNINRRNSTSRSLNDSLWFHKDFALSCFVQH